MNESEIDKTELRKSKRVLVNTGREQQADVSATPSNKVPVDVMLASLTTPEPTVGPLKIMRLYLAHGL